MGVPLRILVQIEDCWQTLELKYPLTQNTAVDSLLATAAHKS
jgi:hypothetical protein